MNVKPLFYKISFVLTTLLFVCGPSYPLYAQQALQPTEDPGGKVLRKKIEPPAQAATEKEKDLPGAKKKTGKEPVVVEDADYFYERGVLFSVYGNYRAAIQSFKKAAELAPGWGQAYFQLGVSYGENGRYEDAIKAIDKAIELDAENGAYYYGRGRVYLMSGDRPKAMEDFEKAADMGNKDAKRFLEKQLP